MVNRLELYNKTWRGRAKRSAPDAASRSLPRITVARLARIDPAAQMRALLRAGPLTFSCAIGAAGIRRLKIEGDRATPAGRFACVFGFFKASAGPRPRALMPLRPIDTKLGWCDDPQAAAYNRPIRLPSRFRHEDMCRADGLYDIVVVIDYNFTRRVRNRGSAIFLHCAQPNFAPTAGCIALAPAAWRRLLPRLSRRAVIIVT
jgi:L,D-peptidoglycan transpeptidase YkuD (ErfK/YbiS/YcfS/YnhG family)